MRRAFSVVVGASVVIGALTGLGEAATISLFFNASYVDTAREGPNLQSTLTGVGHTVNIFTGISAADFTAATGGGAILVIPEMEVGNLYDDLDGAARAFLTSFVSGGGSMIQANYYEANSNLPNGLFGYALSQVGNIDDTNLDAAAAAGTPFASGPAVAPGSSAVEGVLSSSLPLGALNIYHNATESSLFTTTFGAGRYIYLGFDWFEEPTPDAWSALAGEAVELAGGGTQPIPEPASLLLIGTGLALAAARRRRS